MTDHRSLYHHRDHGHKIFRVSEGKASLGLTLTDFHTGESFTVRTGPESAVFFCSDFCGCEHRKGPNAREIYYPRFSSRRSSDG